MQAVIVVMLIVAMITLFLSGYFVGLLRERYGKSWIMVVPIFLAMFMVNVIWALTELAKNPRWQ